ncbi:unnamed protein product [Linum trigynum]|uniref:Transposase-associated domain-containing protein n=1 Tax=Linum trigynum TaxID=586398 RepID=A0AAV2GUU3_9ROSI
MGVSEFIGAASKHVDTLGRTRCPCKRCNNRNFKKLEIVADDITRNGMVETYTTWIHHGESFDIGSTRHQPRQPTVAPETEGLEDDMTDMLGDMLRASSGNAPVIEGSTTPNYSNLTDLNDKLARLIRDANLPLYPGCKDFSRLSFVMKLLNNKLVTNSTDKAFNMNLDLVKKALPVGETLPSSFYEVKRYMEDLGFGYTTIDACPYHCVLYRGPLESAKSCPKCNESRYIPGKQNNVAQKKARYFPLKDRLQRLYMTKEDAKDMRWHKDLRVDDDTLRHPADGKTWKRFDEEHSWFSADPRNVRLALLSDGFNPFGNMSNSYSMWPVVLTPYNLPPWKCMTEPYFILAVLILGEKSPGNNIHVYLEPLIEILRELWEDGVSTYDAHSNETFRLHAALLWTINDFPAYGMLSGWSTKGRLACPVCNSETCYERLDFSHKECYMGHRRCLAV